MSTGPGSSGVPPGPVRSATLQQLEKELWHAHDVGETAYAAELEARIARLSQGSPQNPRKETTGRTTARKQRTR